MRAMKRGESTPTVAYWGHDRRDSTLKKRARMFHDSGAGPLAMAFDRGEGPAPTLDGWKDVDLGRTADAKHLSRVASLLKAVFTARKALASAGEPPVHVARNLDMLLLAIAAATLRPSRKRRIVYECLDIHRALSGSGFKSAALRAVERFALRFVDRIAVSSEAFITAYFKPRQGWTGPVTLLENRLYSPDQPIERPAMPSATAEGPLVVVWPGMLRCQVTLDIFKVAALELGDRIEFRLHGKIQSHALKDFDAQIADFPNITYHGPFRFPDGLAEVYRGAHLVWAQDLWRTGGNSDWLIPNRLYEGGFHGVPSVAVRGSETARIIAERDWGFALPDAKAMTAASFFSRISRELIAAKQAQLLSMPRSQFETTQERAQAEIRELISGRRSDEPGRSVAQDVGALGRASSEP